MFLQRLERIVQEYEVYIHDDHARIKDAKTLSQALTEKASEMLAVTPYKPYNAVDQRKLSIIHALYRADVKGDRTNAAEQFIPSYNGCHAGLKMEQLNSHACFHMSYSQPPNKSVDDEPYIQALQGERYLWREELLPRAPSIMR